MSSATQAQLASWLASRLAAWPTGYLQISSDERWSEPPGGGKRTRIHCTSLYGQPNLSRLVIGRLLVLMPVLRPRRRLPDPLPADRLRGRNPHLLPGDRPGTVHEGRQHQRVEHRPTL